MKVLNRCWVGVAALLIAGSASADERTWQGVNTTSATSYDDNDVDDVSLWDTGVPGPGDDAIMDRSSSSYVRELVIPAGATFNPDGRLDYLQGSGGNPYVPLYIQKDLVLDSIHVDGAATSGGLNNDLIIFGSSGATSRGQGMFGYAWVHWYNSGYTDGPIDSPQWVGTMTVSGTVGAVTYDTADYADMTVAQFAAVVNADTAVHGVAAASSWRRLYLRSQDTGPTSFVTVSNSVARADGGPRWEHYNRPATNGVVFYGQPDTAVTVELTNSIPIVLSGSTGNSWHTMRLAENSRLLFSNPSVTMQQLDDTMYNGPDYMAAHAGSSVEFSAVGGTVTLDDPGRHPEGLLALGNGAALKVRSDQTWLNPTGLGWFYRYMTPNDVALVEASDAQPLNNLEVVHFLIENRAGQFNDATLTPVPAGVYGSFRTSGYYHYGQWNGGLRLTGNVTLRGLAIVPGNNTDYATHDPTYGLYLTGRRYYGSKLKLDGYTLTVDKSILVDKDRNGATNWRASGNEYDGGLIMLDISGSTLNVGSNLDVRCSAGWNAGYIGTYTGGLEESRRTGLQASSAGTVNLGGNFSSNVRCLGWSYDGMTLITFNLLGGTESSPATWEVTADPSLPDYGSGSFGKLTGAIGTMNVGTGGDSAYVQLVNDYLNDNDPANTNKVKEGEILLVQSMSIVNGTLDCNGLGVAVSNLASIAASGVLDLNTGLTLSNPETVTNFFGVGDQSVEWEGAQTKVIDSSNPTMAFRPLYVGGDDKTYWEAYLPPPRGLVIQCL